MTAGTGVRLDCDGPVATVTLCRPEVLNAQTPAMWRALSDFSRDLPGDIRVVIVRGEGRAFSAGLDLSVANASGDGSLAELATLAAQECAERIAEFQAGFTWLHRPDIISVAAVQGHAIGAGFQLALACDLRVLADDAKFCMAEVNLGLVPDLAGTKRLVDLVGYARALEICVTGRRMNAAEADRIGLATVVVPTVELSDAVRDLTAGLLAN
ncbi:MAG: enoyl-CoA hydratase/isomerase family protein, partial [Micromonospora sp.]